LHRHLPPFPTRRSSDLDLKISGSTRLGRFVDVATNSFTDQMFSVEQMIPLSGKNQSRARIAAAEALSGLEELRRKELDAVAKARDRKSTRLNSSHLGIS